MEKKLFVENSLIKNGYTPTTVTLFATSNHAWASVMKDGERLEIVFEYDLKTGEMGEIKSSNPVGKWSL